MSEPPDERKAHLGCFVFAAVIGFVQMRWALPFTEALPHVPWFVCAAGVVIGPFAIASQIAGARRWEHPVGDFAVFALTSGGTGWSLGLVCGVLSHSLSAPPRWDLIVPYAVLGTIIALGWRISGGGAVLTPTEENRDGTAD